MNLTENEKRMVYQVESTCQAAILNEIAMNKRYAPNPEIRQTAESLLSKLRLLSDKECMALVNDVQKNYRLPGKARTIGEMLAEARQKSGAEKLAGHDIMALERDGGTVATTSALAVFKPENAVLISESGIQSPADVRAALAAGADGVLVGTAIWMAEDPVSCYRTLSIAENTDR